MLQRMVIKTENFRVSKKKTPKKAWMLRVRLKIWTHAFRYAFVIERMAHQWFRRFRDENFDVEDVPSSVGDDDDWRYKIS